MIGEEYQPNLWYWCNSVSNSMNPVPFLHNYLLGLINYYKMYGKYCLRFVLKILGKLGSYYVLGFLCQIILQEWYIFMHSHKLLLCPMLFVEHFMSYSVEMVIVCLCAANTVLTWLNLYNNWIVSVSNEHCSLHPVNYYSVMIPVRLTLCQNDWINVYFIK